LILSRRRNIFSLSEVYQEATNFKFSHFNGVAFVMKENEPFYPMRYRIIEDRNYLLRISHGINPLNIRIFGASAEMSESCGFAHLV
jgi:primase-polymerase (primpol)-like protein